MGVTRAGDEKGHHAAEVEARWRSGVPEVLAGVTTPIETGSSALDFPK